MKTLPEIKAKGAGIVFTAGIVGIDANLVIYEAGHYADGSPYVSAIAKSKDLSKRRRAIVAAVAIRLWEKFAE
jgi:hypothetical protein